MTMQNISSCGLDFYEKSAISAVRALETAHSRLEGEGILMEYLEKTKYCGIGEKDATESIFRVCDIVFSALVGYCGSEAHLAKDAHITGNDYFSLLKFYIKRAEITPNLIRAHQQRIGHTAIKNGRIDVIEMLTGFADGSVSNDPSANSCTIVQMCGYDINSIRIVARKSIDMQRFLYQRAFLEIEAVEAASGTTGATSSLSTGINLLRFMQNLETFKKFKMCVIAEFIAINKSDAQKARKSALTASNEADEAYKKFELYAKEQKSATTEYSVVEAINASLATVVENAAFACQHAIQASILCERVAADTAARSVFDNTNAALRNAHEAATYSELVNRTINEYMLTARR